MYLVFKPIWPGGHISVWGRPPMTVKLLSLKSVKVANCLLGLSFKKVCGVLLNPIFFHLKNSFGGGSL